MKPKVDAECYSGCRMRKSRTDKYGKMKTNEKGGGASTEKLKDVLLKFLAIGNQMPGEKSSVELVMGHRSGLIISLKKD